MAQISYSVTANSITAWISGLDTSYNQTTRSCYWILSIWGDGTTVQTKTSTIPNKVSSSSAVVFSGLSAGSSYALSVTISNITGSSDVILEAYKITTSQEPTYVFPVSAWDWNKSNGVASASQTQKAYYAAKNKGYVSDFSYLVWNDMIDKVNAVCNAVATPFVTATGTTGMSRYGWDSSYGSLAATKMSSTDRTLTAQRYHAFLINVSRGRGKALINPESIRSGGALYGVYLTDLMSVYLNEWIYNESNK